MHGRIFILSGPSGAGKNTIINALREKNVPFRYIPSYTTRNMRPGESEGNPYHFVSEEEFKAIENRGEFLEVEPIHGNWYGTHKMRYLEAIERGEIVLKDIDVNGALNFKRVFPNHAVLIYVRPTTLDVLKDRLFVRGDGEEDISTRMSRIDWEESKSPLFDHVVYNDDLDFAVRSIEAIVSPKPV